jgi:hypothetical protein
MAAAKLAFPLLFAAAATPARAETPPASLAKWLLMLQLMSRAWRFLCVCAAATVPLGKFHSC